MEITTWQQAIVVLLIVLVLPAVLLFGLSEYFDRDRELLVERGLPHHAIVSEVLYSRHRYGKWNHAIEYWFRREGKVFRNSTVYFSDNYDDPAKGDTILIYYDPDDPSINLPDVLLE